MTGEKEILGFYIGDSEGAKYWTSRYQNCGVTLSELHTYFLDRVDIN